MSDIAKAIDEVVGRSIAPALRQDRFRKSGRTFSRTLDHGIQVVNVQAGRGNVGSEGKFTLNLGIYFPAVEKLLKGDRLNPAPKEYDCTLRKRIGSLMPGGRDHWWEILTDTNLDELAGRLTETWINFGKPWLERHSNLIHAAEDDQTRLDTRAAIYLVLNRKEDAVRVLKEGLPGLSQRNAAFADAILGWARSKSLTIEL